MSSEDECRTAFEAQCQLMRVEWSLEWDKAGFYSQLETDRAYTWFKFGFDRENETMLPPIEPHAGGKLNLSLPQQKWTFTDDSCLMATARFAGHMVEAITDDAGAFDLMYLGFRSKGYSTMDDAKAAAPDFARRVLQRLSKLITN